MPSLYPQVSTLSYLCGPAGTPWLCNFVLDLIDDLCWSILLSNICGIYLSLTQTSRFVLHWRLYFLMRLAALLPVVMQPFYSVSLCHHSLNGSLPSNVEIRNNTLFFKGPVTYDLAGTYVCDATNSIGTRTGIVEMNITGRLITEAISVFCHSVTPAWFPSIQYPTKNVVRRSLIPICADKHKYPCTCTHRLIVADCLCVLHAVTTCPGCAAPLHCVSG